MKLIGLAHLLVLAALSASASANGARTNLQARVTPVQKVIQLLGDMQARVRKHRTAEPPQDVWQLLWLGIRGSCP